MLHLLSFSLGKVGLGLNYTSNLQQQPWTQDSPVISLKATTRQGTLWPPFFFTVYHPYFTGFKSASIKIAKVVFGLDLFLISFS